MVGLSKDTFIIKGIILPTEPHISLQKTTKACHKGIKKLRFLYDFGVFSAWDCRLRFTAPTYLNGVLTQSFSTNRFAFRWLFLRSSAQSSKLVSRPRIKKACHFRDKLCELAGTRTQGPYIKSVLLYQLSYQF